EIRAGPGRVVLTTVNHLSRGICNLTYTTQDGKSETIRPTISHRFFSLDRNEWIHIGDARFGEKLQGFGNTPITVVSVIPFGGTERVYNMTVEEDHVFYVGYLNLLTHNLGCLTYNGKDGWVSPQRLKYGMDKNPYNIHALKHTPGGWYEQGDTVFKLEKDADLFALLDEAWEKRTGYGKPQKSGGLGYEINMGRVIGTKGEKKVFIVVEGLLDGPYSVVTAFPVM
ncbi:MAG: hypothetical protein LBG58_04515, partial [Planctomycetaceae bacterium]|nr:hypothetical protein [Planctomycetaceae bacterium]